MRLIEPQILTAQGVMTSLCADLPLIWDVLSHVMALVAAQQLCSNLQLV